MRFAKVRVARSEAFVQTVTVGAWEVPLLRAVHGEGTVQIIGEQDDKRREYPDAATEFERLSTKYGSPGGSTTSYAQAIYGHDGAGLAKAIAEAAEDEKNRAPVPVPAAQIVDPAVRGYLAAEAKQLEQDREAFQRERAQAQQDIEAQFAAEREKLAAERAALEAEKQRVEAERNEVAALLDAATAAPVAEPISE